MFSMLLSFDIQLMSYDVDGTMRTLFQKLPDTFLVPHCFFNWAADNDTPIDAMMRELVLLLMGLSKVGWGVNTPSQCIP